MRKLVPIISDEGITIELFEVADRDSKVCRVYRGNSIILDINTQNLMASNSEQRRQKRLESQRQKAKRNARKDAKRRLSRPYLPDIPEKLGQFVLDPRKLTTPKDLDENVLKFCQSINPDCMPIYLTIEPEPWCRQSCCDLNVLKFVEQIGGRILCGYKIWYHAPFYIEAERHAVHQSKDGSLKDPTFTTDGEPQILFIEDVPDKSHKLEDNVDKIRLAFDNRLAKFVCQLNNHERQSPIQKRSSAQSWSTMITYEDWLSAERQVSVRVERR